MCHYNAILCEGSTEQTIMNILLSNDKLIIDNDDFLIGGRPIRPRNAESFCRQYLNKNYKKCFIRIYRILDSKREKFDINHIKENYSEKVEVINTITSPEIEMLLIIAENEYDSFMKKKNKFNGKPSEYCKQLFKGHNIKSKKFIEDYFCDVEKLINTIKIYAQKSNHKNTLYNLIKK